MSQKCIGDRGSALDPAGGAYSSPPDPIAGFKGHGGKGKGGMGWEGKGMRDKSHTFKLWQADSSALLCGPLVAAGLICSLHWQCKPTKT